MKPNKYVCVRCEKVELIYHINPIVEPYLCYMCMMKDLEEQRKQMQKGGAK